MSCNGGPAAPRACPALAGPPSLRARPRPYATRTRPPPPPPRPGSEWSGSGPDAAEGPIGLVESRAPGSTATRALRLAWRPWPDTECTAARRLPQPRGLPGAQKVHRARRPAPPRAAPRIPPAVVCPYCPRTAWCAATSSSTSAWLRPAAGQAPSRTRRGGRALATLPAMASTARTCRSLLPAAPARPAPTVPRRCRRIAFGQGCADPSPREAPAPAQRLQPQVLPPVQHQVQQPVHLHRPQKVLLLLHAAGHVMAPGCCCPAGARKSRTGLGRGAAGQRPPGPWHLIKFSLLSTVVEQPSSL